MTLPASLRRDPESSARRIASGGRPRPITFDDAQPPADSNARRWAHALAAVAIGILLTAVVVQYSLRHGRLCTLPTFDDVSYMSAGVERLQVFYDQGFEGACREYLRAPPHSPYSEFLAMGAFAVFGPHDWAPYVANGLLAIAFVLAADFMLRGVRWWQRIGCLLFFVTIPFVPMAVHEFRPDPAEALATALGVMVLLHGPLARSRWHHPLSAGVVAGVALLIKPTVFPATLVYFGAAFVLAILCDIYAYRHRLRSREILRVWLLCIVPAVVIALPHYLLDHRQIYNYIRDLEFGAHATTVAVVLPLGKKLLYYLNGDGGQPMLGTHTWILLLLAGLGLLWNLKRRKRHEILPALAVVMVMALTYAVPTQNPLKQPFLGLTFDVILALAALRWLGLMLRGMPSRLGGQVVCAVSLAGLLSVGLAHFQWPPRYGQPGDKNLEEKNQIIERVYHDVMNHTAAPGPGLLTYDKAGTPVSTALISNRPVALFSCLGDLNPNLLQYLADRDDSPAHFDFTLDSKEVSDYMKLWDKADFVIAGDSGCGFFTDFMFCSKIQDQLVAAMRDRPDFIQIDAPMYSATQKKVYVFQRVDFGGWTPTSGLGPIEGPLPAFKHRVVRWGLGPQTIVKVVADRAGKYELRWDARSWIAMQRIDVMLDGQAVGSATVDHGIGSSRQFATDSIPLTLSAGEHQLELRYATADQGTDMPRAVLFRSLRVRALAK